jgi:hypothetical protein
MSGLPRVSANDPIAPAPSRHVRLLSKLVNSAWALACLLSLVYVTWYTQLS